METGEYLKKKKGRWGGIQNVDSGGACVATTMERIQNGAVCAGEEQTSKSNSQD